MSHGSTHRFPVEHHSAELARLMAVPAVAERMKQEPQLVDAFDVPDLAGYSTDGAKVYFDRHFFNTLNTAVKINNLEMKPQQIKQALLVHEHVEKTLIDVLGYSYAAAHEMATTAEHEAVRALGVNPDVYEKALKPFIKRAELEHITNPPLDLDCHPYYEHPDAQDLKILAHLAELGVKDAQEPQQKLSHQAVGYAPGHKPEFCDTCKHFIAKGSACHLVADPIGAKGWCKLWVKK